MNTPLTHPAKVWDSIFEFGRNYHSFSDSLGSRKLVSEVPAVESLTAYDSVLEGQFEGLTVGKRSGSGELRGEGWDEGHGEDP